jgi:hypothetical protein
VPTLIVFFPFILLFAIYVAISVLHAAYVKLSGNILRGSFVSWKHAFIFALGISALTLIGRTVAVAGGFSVPLALAVIFSLVLQLIFGGWFFSTRGITKQGQSFGWLGGVRISALAFLFLAVTGALVNGVVHIIAMAVQS